MCFLVATRVGVGSIRFFFVWVLFVFSRYNNNNTRGRNFFWVLLSMFSCCKRDMRCKIIFLGLFFYVFLLWKAYEVWKFIMVFTLCFLATKEYKVQQKKLFPLNMFSYNNMIWKCNKFLGYFFIMFPCNNKNKRYKKNSFYICFFPLLQKNW